MGRPKGGKNKKYSYEFKLQVIEDYFKNHLSKTEVMNKYSINSSSLFERWKNYYQEGILKEGKTQNRGNKLAALHTSKSLTKEEQLELENLKLRIENERLKKGYQVKGGGANKEYITLSDANTKSLKH